MSNKQELESLNKLKKEYNEFNNHHYSGSMSPVDLPDENNYFKWRLHLVGPKDTSYKGGLFIAIIDIPKDYPNSPPESYFKTPIYHLNVNPIKSDMLGAKPLGYIDIPILRFWKKEYTIREICTEIFSLFYLANPESFDALNNSYEYKYERDLYEEKVKYFTKKYADPRFANIYKEYDESWDFSYGKN